MEAPADLTHIVKGVRTKRQRPHSPIPSITRSAGDIGHCSTNRHHDNNHPSSFSDVESVSITSEDEETAKCLILLAQGHHFPPRNNKIVYDHHDHDHEYDYHEQEHKFNSKRFIETSSTNGNRAGMFVYECKTCSRTFPSFQALGGHRASHKKPKNMAKRTLVLSDSEDDFTLTAYTHHKNDTKFMSASLSLQHVNKKSNPTSLAYKVHECSYCGAEFTSGQALGGHMRRHRGGAGGGGGPTVGAAYTALSLGPVGVENTTFSLSNPMSTTSFDYYNQESDGSKKTTRNCLSLDLNLPAPEDEHKQQQQQQQQKDAAIVFSTTPALVDCHY